MRLYNLENQLYVQINKFQIFLIINYKVDFQKKT